MNHIFQTTRIGGTINSARKKNGADPEYADTCKECKKVPSPDWC